MKTIEYRVRPVTRYVITKFTNEEGKLSSQPIGEFDNEILASNAALAFASHETQMAQAADKVIRHDGVVWNRAMGRWNNEAVVKTE